MKYIAFIFTVIFSVITLKASDDRIQGIDVKNGRIPILIDGEWEIKTLYDAQHLLEDNIYAFFGITDCTTDLKKQVFERSTEYTDSLLPRFKKIKSDFMNTNYGVAYNLYGNSNYDVVKKCFKFEISSITATSISLPNTFTLDNYFTITVPKKAFELETYTALGKTYESRYLITPEIPVEIALDVEDSMTRHPCPYSLLFVVKIEGTKDIVNFIVPNTYTLSKAVKLYLYNTAEDRIVMSLNSIFTEQNTRSNTTTKGTTKKKTQSSSMKRKK